MKVLGTGIWEQGVEMGPSWPQVVYATRIPEVNFQGRSALCPWDQVAMGMGAAEADGSTGVQDKLPLKRMKTGTCSSLHCGEMQGFVTDKLEGPWSRVLWLW